MAQAHPALSDEHVAFIEAQPMFFVASAPSSDEGHVNLSPKGYDTFRVLGPNRVAYLDLTGSGAETIAHLRQNGRMTIMFCAFEGRPEIMRLYGTGTVVVAGDDDFGELMGQFEARPGIRSVIVVEVNRVQTSCGYAVPFMSFDKARPGLDNWARGKSDEQLVAYRAEKNARSIDGLPAF